MPVVIQTHDQGIMRTKAHSDQVVGKTERFPVSPVQVVGIRTKPDNVKAVSESSENRLVLLVMRLTP